jgi:hypothetical protein
MSSKVALTVDAHGPRQGTISTGGKGTDQLVAPILLNDAQFILHLVAALNLPSELPQSSAVASGA